MRHAETVSVRGRPVPELRSTANTARLLDCSVRTVYRLVKRGELRPVRLGRDLRFELGEIESYLDRNREVVGSP
jgi:excisionase family DNA binding protein